VYRVRYGGEDEAPYVPHARRLVARLSRGSVSR
jgi:hypothetical protein